MMRAVVVALVVTVSCGTPLGARAEPGDAAEIAELRSELDALRADAARLEEQQRRNQQAIAALTGRLDVLVAGGTRATAPDDGTGIIPTSEPATRAAMSEHRPLTAAVPTPVDRAMPLIVSGDVRIRGSGDFGNPNARSRVSSQLRARLGASYRLADRLLVGARIVTGDPDDPNSSDAQLSNFDDDLQANLDQAYLQLDLGPLQAYGGKFPQPFTRTDLVWDADVSPEGVAAKYRKALRSGNELRVAGGWFIVDERAGGPDSSMSGVQVEYAGRVGSTWRYQVASAYYDYVLGSVAGGDAGDFRTNLLRADGSYLSKFHLLDTIANMTWTGGPARWPATVSLEAVRNLGAAAGDDSGYALEFGAGRVREVGDWRFGYGFFLAESDAVFAAFSHDNIAFGSNYRMHSLTFDYVPLTHTTLSASWYRYRQMESLIPASGPPHWLDRVRVSVAVNF